MSKKIGTIFLTKDSVWVCKVIISKETYSMWLTDIDWIDINKYTSNEIRIPMKELKLC